MAFKFNCPVCAATLVAPDDMVGRQMRCGACQEVFAVPEPPAPAVDEPRYDPAPSPREDEPRDAHDEGRPWDRSESRPEPRDDGPPRRRRRRRPPPPPPRGRGVLFWLLLIFGGLFLLGIAACGGGYMLLPGEKWHRHESTEGGFAVETPVALKKDAPVPGFKPEPGQKVEGAVLWKRGEAYFVLYGDILPRHMRAEPDERILEEGVNGMRSEPGTRIVRVDNITVSGFPAREVECLYSDGGTYIARIIVADRRLYVLISGGRFVRPGNANVRRFLDSFEVTDPAQFVEIRRKQEEERREAAKKEAIEHAGRDNEAFRTAPYTGPRPGDPRALVSRCDDLVYFPCDEVVTNGVGRWGETPVLLDQASTGAGVRGDGGYVTASPLLGKVQVWLGDVPSRDRPLGTTGYTLSGWYRTRSNGLMLLRLWPVGASEPPWTKRGAFIAVNGQHVRAVMADGTGQSELTAPRPADEAWHHVTLVCTATDNGPTAELYLDGARVADGPGRLVQLPGATIICGTAAGQGGWAAPHKKGGYQLPHGMREWIAAVDECCLFPHPLGVADVRKLAGRETMPDRILKQGTEFRTPFPVPDPKTLPGLKMYFPFDEMEGRYARDAVAGSVFLETHDAETVAGTRGAAVRITGPTGYQKPSWGIRSKVTHGDMDVGMPIGVAEGKPCTLAFWVRTDEAGKTQPDSLIWFMGRRTFPSDARHYFGISRVRDRIKLTLNDYPGSFQELKIEASRPYIKPGEWAHIAVVRDEKGAMRWAVDGEVEAIEKEYDGSLLIHRLLLGSANQNHKSGSRTALRFTADFDELCIFDRALTDDELAALAGRKALPKK